MKTRVGNSVIRVPLGQEIEITIKVRPVMRKPPSPSEKEVRNRQLLPFVRAEADLMTVERVTSVEFAQRVSKRIGHEVTPLDISSALRKFKVRPKSHHIDGKVSKGYKLKELRDALQN